MTSKEKADLVLQYADEIKAERIEVLDVHAKTSVTDYFIVCSGTSDTHIRSIVDRIQEKMLTHAVKPLRSETSGAEWVLLDFGDVVVHVMKEEKRQFYDLETLWTTMQPDPNLL